MLSKDIETAIQQLEDDGHFELAMSVKSTIEQLQKEVERLQQNYDELWETSQSWREESGN